MKNLPQLATGNGRQAGPVDIPFVKPSLTRAEVESVLNALQMGAIGGNGQISSQTQAWLRDYLQVKHALLTTSCTHALEMAMLGLELGPGDEVILPSFAFVTAATAIIRQGATPVFAEIDEATLNLDPADVARRITPRTRAIVLVHYAGLACQMDTFLELAAAQHLYLIEDAAQALGATYRGRPLGTLGHIGCFSFHSTKNVVAGEGGAFVTDDEAIGQRAEMIREKGTNRAKFLRGEVDKYTWVDLGSSYVISDLLAALLYAQLQRLAEITQARQRIWWHYYEQMAGLETEGWVIRPGLLPQAEHNAHIYALRVTGQRRDQVLSYLKAHGVGATFHFVPLHSSPYGQKHLGYKVGDFPITERASDSLIRLPLYPELSLDQANDVLNVLADGLRYAG
jgi:dTDP-4-amino-4,6-dideoxygalactose transaminase